YGAAREQRPARHRAHLAGLGGVAEGPARCVMSYRAPCLCLSGRSGQGASACVPGSDGGPWEGEPPGDGDQEQTEEGGRCGVPTSGEELRPAVEGTTDVTQRVEHHDVHEVHTEAEPGEYPHDATRTSYHGAAHGRQA